MPVSVRDFFEFLFNDGKGIKSSQIDGKIGREQLSDDFGYPDYLHVRSRYIAESNTVDIEILDGIITDFPVPCEIAFVVPRNMGRSLEPLYMSVNGAMRFRVQDISFGGVNARMLNPGCFHKIFITKLNRYLFTAALPARVQSWNIRLALSEDDILDVDEIQAGTTSGSEVIEAPSANLQSYVYIGVPDDTGDIEEITFGGFNRTSFYTKIIGTINDEDGTPYKWWRSFNRQNSDVISGEEFSIRQQGL